MKFLSSGGCLFFALFCVYGFIASGEYDGTRELAWKSGYAALGLASLATSVWLASKKR